MFNDDNYYIIYIITRETATFGGIFLALRESATFGDGKRRKNFGVPHMALKTSAGP